MKDLRELLTVFKEIGADFIESKEDEPRTAILAVNRDIYNCKSCGLYKTKNNYVPGEGSISPDIFFVGEGPGETEDKFGKPFIGKAGQLLDKIISKMGYTRESVFIGNIVKCRPPNNRDPLREEIDSCILFLKRQIEILKPKVIVCLGRVALNNLLRENFSISKARGTVFQFNNIPLIPTYHPSYILHKKEQSEISKVKWEMWSDMEKVLEIVRSA